MKADFTSSARGKIKDLDELAQLMAQRTNSQKLVYCHGVFDLLHIGHIRHLEEAKDLGNILVVTVTPDHHVNKGPNRPAFNQDLRAEALAALDCVDYVAINRWPLAVEAIKLLRPDLYVKGSDYQHSQDDLTGGIVLEEAAVKAVGGGLAFTNGVTSSSSSLINRHMGLFPKPVSDYLADFGSRYSFGDVLRYLEGARPLKTLVVGETIIDEYQYCQAIGKSSKDPMLALKHVSTERFAGGIIAIANHVSNFCNHAGIVTVLGLEGGHEEFIRSRLKPNVQPSLLYRNDGPTILKRRYIDEYYFSKLLEVYEMNDAPLNPKLDADLCAVLRDQVPQHDVVVVADFGHGMLSEAAIKIICDHSRFLAVNCQSNAGNLGYNTISRYPRADLVCIAEQELRLNARDRSGDLGEMAVNVSRSLQCKGLVVTKGSNGILTYSEDEGFSDVPAFANQVIDRTGAGDAVFSVISLCVAQGAPMEIVGFIGNAVGAQAVGIVGNRTPVEPVDLFKHMEALLK